MNARIRETQLVLDRITGYRRKRQTRKYRGRKGVEKTDAARKHAGDDAHDEQEDMIDLEKECEKLCRISISPDSDSDDVMEESQ